MRPVRASRAALAAVSVAVLAAAGCSSKTAAEQAGTVPAAAASSAAAPSLVPPGVTDVLADAKKRVADSLSGGAGFTPPSTGPKAPPTE